MSIASCYCSSFLSKGEAVCKIKFKLTKLFTVLNLLLAISFGNNPLRSPFLKGELLLIYSESYYKIFYNYLNKIC